VAGSCGRRGAGRSGRDPAGLGELAVSPLVGSCPDGRFGAIITQETWKGISPTVPAAGLSG